MRRRLLLAIGAALLLILGGVLLQGVVLPALLRSATPTPVAVPSPEPSLEPSPTPEERARITVKRVQGSVERQREGAEWDALKTGDELTLADSIRTQSGGEAELEVGDTATVTVAEESRVQVAEISRQTARLRLDGGRIAARVHGTDQASLKVEFQNSDAVVEAKQGAEFAAMTAGAGQVTVASTAGTVKLIARKGEVEIPAGSQSVANADEAPAPPALMSRSLLLKLGKPPARALRENKTIVTGESTPGALVTVNGVYTQVGIDGRFKAVVPLKEGKNTLVVVARDVRGERKKAELGTVTVDTRPVAVDGKVKWK